MWKRIVGIVAAVAVIVVVCMVALERPQGLWLSKTEAQPTPDSVAVDTIAADSLFVVQGDTLP